MQVLYYALLALNILLLILIFVTKDKKFIILSLNCRIVLRRENTALNLYQNGKKMDYAFLSFGNLFSWYVLGQKQVYIISRFKNQIDTYDYDHLPQIELQKISEKVDLDAFLEHIYTI